MRHLLPILVLLGAASAASGAEVSDTSYTSADGMTVLRHEVVLEAPVSAVWQTLTTAAGWKTWAVPTAHGEFTVGAVVETSYDPKAQPGDPRNIHNRMLAYLPERLFVFQAVRAPPGFPHPELLPELFSVAELEPLDADRTRLRFSGVGYRATPAHQTLYRFFQEGNAWTLQQLAERFRTGPRDWTKARPPGAPKH